MQLKFDPSDNDEVRSVLRMIRVNHPIIWQETVDEPTSGLSPRTRRILQQHGLCSTEQLLNYTRNQAIETLGEVAVTEIEELKLGEWRKDDDS